MKKKLEQKLKKGINLDKFQNKQPEKIFIQQFLNIKFPKDKKIYPVPLDLSITDKNIGKLTKHGNELNIKSLKENKFIISNYLNNELPILTFHQKYKCNNYEIEILYLTINLIKQNIKIKNKSHLWNLIENLPNYKYTYIKKGRNVKRESNIGNNINNLINKKIIKNKPFKLNPKIINQNDYQIILNSFKKNYFLSDF